MFSILRTNGDCSVWHLSKGAAKGVGRRVSSAYVSKDKNAPSGSSQTPCFGTCIDGERTESSAAVASCACCEVGKGKRMKKGSASPSFLRNITVVHSDGDAGPHFSPSAVSIY